MPDRPAQQLRKLIDDAETIVAFTGAGISTESGVPDFRSPGGVWSRMKPIQFDDFLASEDMRRESWRRRFANEDNLVGAKPNAGHNALVTLAARGKLSSVITQNIDNLHQDSGLSDDQVIELHGNASYAKCLDCGHRHELDDIKSAFLEREELPTCDACGGMVKSAVISFGQPMPAEPMQRARAESVNCDLFLALGSSLQVYPAAGFPVIAKKYGAKLVIINRDETDLDPLADLVINDQIGTVLPNALAQ